MQDIIKKTARELLFKRCIELLIILKHSRSRLPHHGIYVAHVAGKNGIEIGGPSLVFKTALPLYQKVGALDGVNFSHRSWAALRLRWIEKGQAVRRRGFRFIRH